MSNDHEADTNNTQARLPIAAASANESSESEQSENTLLPPSEVSKSDTENATLVGATPVASRLFPGLPAVPGYEIRREVARGGMGVVYLAHDPKFDRDVAVKIMHAGQDADRFVIESKVTARLPHPGVPPVYALGELGDGRPFLAMKLIAGRTLAEEIRQVQQSDLPRMLGVFEQICHTVGFAHSQQIIHRDLKPANVMVGAFGEVLVMDWGLAKDLSATIETQSDAQFTRSKSIEETLAGQVKGTPAYMAPEQARGEPVDARADVFALGGILCAILTGKAPFGGTTVLDTIRMASSAELQETYARLEQVTFDPDILAIAKKCLAGEAQNRYADGAEVGTAVARYREAVAQRAQDAERERAAAEARAAEAVNTRREAEARTEAEVARANEQRKRRNVQLALAASLMLLASGVGAAAWWQDHQSAQRKLSEQRAEAEQQRLEAEQRATQSRLQAEQEFKVQQARQGVAANLALAAELREQYRFQQAETVLKQAELLARGAVPELLPRIAKTQTDLKFVAQLDAIRFRKWVFKTQSDASRKSSFDTKRAISDYKLAFASQNLDLTILEPAVAAQQISGSEVKAQLVAAVDDWALYETNPALQLRLLEIARLADPGEWSDRLRNPRARNNQTSLTELAKDPTLQKATSQQISVLAELMNRNDLEPVTMIANSRAIYPSDFELAFLQGQIYSSQQQHSRAIGPYEAARALRPDNAAVWNNLGAAYYDIKETDAALTAFRKSLQLDPSFAQSHNNIGCILQARGEHAEAMAAYKKSLELDPNQVDALFNLGNVYLDTRRYEEAIVSYKKAIANDPEHAWSYNNMGNAYANLRKYPEAIVAYRKAVQIDPQYAFPWFGIGKAEEEQGNLRDAMKAYQKAVAVKPNYANAHNSIGILLRGAKDWDGAIAAYKKAIASEPNYAAAHYNLGLALGAKGDQAGAMASYREALKHDPNMSFAHTNLGLLLQDQGDLKGAIAAFREGIRTDPKNHKAHNNLGIALSESGDLDGAIAAFKKAIEVNPQYTNARDNLEIAKQLKAQRDGTIAPPPREVKP